jgi:organic radical activating enzyme
MIDLDNEFLLFAGENNIPEVFYTVEGEGVYIGRPSVFMRFFGCNLRCPGFKSIDSPNGCDSYVSWTKKNKLSFLETFKLLESNNYIDKLHRGAILKLTGGEPLIRQESLLKFIDAFKYRYGFVPHIDFETNATIMPDERWLTNKYRVTFTTSPKLTSNGDPEEKTYKPDVLKWHVKHKSTFKFVISKSEDLDEIYRKYINPDGDIGVPTTHVWFMPCCGSRSEHIEKAPAVAEYAKAMCVNFSPRLHLLVWDLALRV